MIVQVDEPLIEVHDLTVTYERKPVLWNVDFGIPEASLVGVIGPNGAGKSTLIKSMMGLLEISSGYVKMFNDSLENVRDRVAYVPQRESVDWDFPASALDIVRMGRYRPSRLIGRLSRKDREIADSALEKVGMSAYANRQISRLSGGQQQRVFLARALAQQADLYFMDEPFAGVDAATETAIFKLLQEMRDQGKTIVVVHHDLQSASKYFNWFLMLNTRLVASGPKEQVFTTELLQDTYGGGLSLLSSIGDLLREKDHPIRE